MVCLNDFPDAIQLLELSLEDLNKAALHVDPEYQAQACYDRSKASCHLAILDPPDETHRQICLEDAERAVSLSDEKKFLTWWEHTKEAFAKSAS